MVHVGVLSHHFGDPGGHRDAQQAPGGSVVHFFDFGSHSGSLLGSTLLSLCVFSVILGTKMGDSFHVHVFSDPGMEMMPECSGCMCLNHGNNCGFREIPLFSFIHEFCVQREGFWCYFGVCWWPAGHFVSFVRVLGRGLKFDDFPGIPQGPGSPRAERIQKLGVKCTMSSWGPGDRQNQDYQSHLLLILRLLVQMT